VKIYKLCESSTGCVWNFIVYMGEGTIYGQRHPGEQTSSTIVLEVAHDLLDKSYPLYWTTDTPVQILLTPYVPEKRMLEP